MVDGWPNFVLRVDWIPPRRLQPWLPPTGSFPAVGVSLLQCGRAARRGEAMGRGQPPSSRAKSSRARSEEHTSELQSLMRISYAVFCLKKKKKHAHRHTPTQTEK